MAQVNETWPSPADSGFFAGEKGSRTTHETRRVSDDAAFNQTVQHELNVTEDDFLEAKEIAGSMTLGEVRSLMKDVHKLHANDPNFPLTIITRIEEFLHNDSIFEDPEKHEEIIEEMKLEAALITNNSPYAEVRSVVDNHDDPSIPSSTIRAWAIGLFFSGLLAFVNQLFSIRKPPIMIFANVAQLLSYPLGKACELLPDIGITVFGVRHSLNPGRFSKKEHMLITIMANVAYSTPYTNNIVFIQYLPQYFDQPYAISFGYQLLIALSTNFIGYGMAGVCRRFLVYPSYCVWPASLVTIALNAAFHTEKNTPVLGPFKTWWRISRLKFFVISFGAMFVYFFIPGYLWTSLSTFNWISWIDPMNRNLVTIAGSITGLGVNPWPTWDWNTLLFEGVDPLMVPFFSTFNKFLGALASMFVIIGIWFTNTYNTGYLPINSNRVYDHYAELYKVKKAVDSRRLFNATTYEKYSPPFLSAGNIVVYMFFFAIYTSALTYAALYHRHEIALGFRSLFSSFRKKKDEIQSSRVLDVHNRLMKRYKEVPEWWYGLTLLGAVGLGVAGIASFETYTSPGVVFYGILLCMIFVIPIGIIQAMTGVGITLNVIAEFIGGMIVEGNALSMNYFKTFGMVTCAHALGFSNDLKLAHYVKIPPRQTFWAQMIPTFVSTFVCLGVMNFQLTKIDKLCTKDAQWGLSCPTVNTFFTASVLWGTVGPRKLWGPGGQYTETLVGFPLGVLVVFIFYGLNRWFPKSRWLRSAHPVVMMHGGIIWAQYNISYLWPSVPIAWFSWIYLKSRFLGLWSKYNFVLSAAFSTGIAIAGIIIFFSLQWKNVEVSWWGNKIHYRGCEGNPCVLKLLSGEPNDFFGPKVGEFH